MAKLVICSTQSHRSHWRCWMSGTHCHWPGIRRRNQPTSADCHHPKSALTSGSGWSSCVDLFLPENQIGIYLAEALAIDHQLVVFQNFMEQKVAIAWVLLGLCLKTCRYSGIRRWSLALVNLDFWTDADEPTVPTVDYPKWVFRQYNLCCEMPCSPTRPATFVPDSCTLIFPKLFTRCNKRFSS